MLRLPAFQLHTPTTVAEALEAGDPDALRDCAHRIKGTASYVCAGRLVAVAARIESMAREGTLDGVEPLVARLREALDELSEAVERA